MSRRVRCILCGKEFDVFQDDTITLLEHIRKSHPSTALSDSDQELLATNDSKKTKMEVNNNKVSEVNRANKKDNNKNNDCTQIGIDINCPEELPNKSDGNSSKRNSISKSSKWKDRSSDQTPSEVFVGSQFTRPSNKGSVIIIRDSDSATAGVSKTQVLYKRKYKVQSPLTVRSQKTLYKTSMAKWRPGKGTIVCPKCGANKRPVIKAQSDRVSSSPLGAACILTCWPFCFLPCLFPPPAREYLHCAVCNHFLGIYDRKTEVIEPNRDNLRRKSSDRVETEKKPEYQKPK